MKTSKIIGVIIPIALLTTLTGCIIFPTRGKLASELTCKKRAAEECVNEAFSFVNKEELNEDLPKNVYHFKSDERDLEFQVTASFGYDSFLGTTVDWQYVPVVLCNYTSSVKELYKEDIENVVTQLPIYSGKSLGYDLNVNTNEDIALAVDTIVKVNQIYARELDYNNVSWLESNPAGYVDVNICCNPQNPDLYIYCPGNDDYDTSVSFPINGLVDNSELILEEINNEIDGYYNMVDFPLKVGSKTITLSFPGFYGVTNTNGKLYGHLINRATSICSDSNIAVQETEAAKRAITELITSEIEEERDKDINSYKLIDLQINEYEKSGHKCYCATYIVETSENLSFEHVELYEDISAENYYRAQVYSSTHSLDIEGIKKAFSAL